MTQLSSWLLGLVFVDQIALGRDQSYHLPERKVLRWPSQPRASEQAGEEIERREEFVTGQLRSSEAKDWAAGMRKSHRGSGNEQEKGN